MAKTDIAGKGGNRRADDESFHSVMLPLSGSDSGTGSAQELAEPG